MTSPWSVSWTFIVAKAVARRNFSRSELFSYLLGSLRDQYNYELNANRVKYTVVIIFFLYFNFSKSLSESILGIRNFFLALSKKILSFLIPFQKCGDGWVQMRRVRRVQFSLHITIQKINLDSIIKELKWKSFISSTKANKGLGWRLSRSDLFAYELLRSEPLDYI